VPGHADDTPSGGAVPGGGEVRAEARKGEGSRLESV